MPYYLNLGCIIVLFISYFSGYETNFAVANFFRFVWERSRSSDEDSRPGELCGRVHEQMLYTHREHQVRTVSLVACVTDFLHLLTFYAFHLRQELYINVIKSTKQVVREAWASGSIPDCIIKMADMQYWHMLAKRQQNRASQKIVYQYIGLLFGCA